MGIDYYVTQNDNPPSALIATLKDANDQTVDLSGATQVRFKMRQRGSALLKVDAIASIVNPPGTDGKVKYVWQAGDLDTAGDFDAEFEVAFAGGKILTFPTVPKIWIRIVRQIG